MGFFYIFGILIWWRIHRCNGQKKKKKYKEKVLFSTIPMFCAMEQPKVCSVPLFPDLFLNNCSFKYGIFLYFWNPNMMENPSWQWAKQKKKKKILLSSIPMFCAMEQPKVCSVPLFPDLFLNNCSFKYGVFYIFGILIWWRIHRCNGKKKKKKKKNTGVIRPWTQVLHRVQVKDMVKSI
jgi:hypothetical protein